MLGYIVSARNYIIQAPQGRRTLWFGSITHIVSDLHFALLYPLLPILQTDMGLSYEQIGILRATFSGASAILQLPAGWIADFTGEFWLLLLGNVWVSIGLLGMALASTFMWLLVMSVVGGLGGGFQHPLASGMVSRAYDDSGRATAVGDGELRRRLGQVACASDCRRRDRNQHGLAAIAVARGTGEPRVHGLGFADAAVGRYRQAGQRGG